MFEAAPSGRAKCRGCGRRIDKGVVRFGERLPNPYGEGEMTLWFHPLCGAYMRPEPLLDAIATVAEPLDHADRLEAEATSGLAHRRLPRARGAQRAPTARARCRSCREPIANGAWRIPLTFYEEGMFHDSGFIHAGCALDYFGTSDILDRLRHFSPELSETDVEDLEAALRRTDADRPG